MRNRSAIGVIIGVLVVLTGLTSCAQQADLTIYSGRNEALVGPLLEQLKTAVGGNVEIRYAGSAELAAQLLEEGDGTKADVFFSQDAGALGALSAVGRLDQLPAPVLDTVPPAYRADDGTWVGTSARARVVAYDPRQVTEADLPRGLDDLLDPKWQGKIGYAPTNASFQSFVTGLRVLRGEDGARDWLTKFKANNPVAFDNNVLQLDAVDNGQIALALINHYYWYEKVAEVGQDKVTARLHYVPNDPLGLVNVAGAAVIKGTDKAGFGPQSGGVPGVAAGPAVLRRRDRGVSGARRDHLDEAPAAPAGIAQPAGHRPVQPGVSAADPRPAAADRAGLTRVVTLERPVGRPPVRARRRPPSRDGRSPSPVLIAGAVLAGLVAVVPLVYLAIRAFEPGLDVFLEILARPRTVELAVRSIALAGAVTAACLAIGVVGAWLVVRSDLPGRRWWAVALVLPLAVPSYVAGFTWISEWPWMAGFLGAFGVLTAVSYPYVLLPVAAALRGSDPALEEVARSAGYRPFRVFWVVTLRRIWPASAAGGLLVALYVLSDFGAVSLMRYDAFTLGIFTSYRSTFDRTTAAVLGCVLVAIAALITWGESRARGRAALRVGGGASRNAAPVRLGRWRWAAVAFVVAVVGVALGIPAVSLTHWTLVGSSFGVDLGGLASAAVMTMEVAGLGALLTTVLALPVAVLAARHRGRLTGALETASYAGHALPGITVGLALVFLGIRFLPGIYQEIPLLVLGYAVLFLPLAIGAVRTAVAAAPPQLEDVSRSLGKGRLATLGRVTLPLAAPGIAAGAALVFLTCAKELPATLMLKPTGSDTLATDLWTLTGAGQFAAAAPYAVVLVAVAVVPTLLLDRVLRRSRRTSIEGVGR